MEERRCRGSQEHESNENNTIKKTKESSLFFIIKDVIKIITFYYSIFRIHILIESKSTCKEMQPSFSVLTVLNVYVTKFDMAYRYLYITRRPTT